jgi:hypothetical protein
MVETENRRERSLLYFDALQLVYGAGAASMQSSLFPEYASADHPTQVFSFSKKDEI